MICHARAGWYVSGLFAVCCSLSGCLNSRGILSHAQALSSQDLVTDHAIEEAVQEATWPQDRWWQAYGDPQLDAWVERALQHNPGLAAVAARVHEAMAQTGVSAAAQQPQGDLDVSVQRKHWPNDMFYGPSTLGRTTSWNNISALGISYNLDIWGQLRSNHERGLALAKVVATEERAAALELQGNVVRSYIELALGYAHLEIAEAELQQRQDMLDLVQQRFAHGLSTRFELSEAQAPLPEAHRRVDLAREAIALARNRLAALVGAGPGAGSTLQPPHLNLHAEPKLPSSLPLTLVGRRPDVVARRWAVVSEARGIEVAKADFYPNLNLMASFGSMAVQGGMLDFLQHSKMTYNLGPALNLPVFDGGLRRSVLGATTARYDQAVEAYNQTLVMALKGISDQLIQLHSLHEQHQLVAESVATAKHRYALAKESYERGLTDYRNVLAAQTWLFEKRRLQEEIHASQLSTQARLWIELGGGVLHPQSQPPADHLEPQPIRPHLPWQHQHHTKG